MRVESPGRGWQGSAPGSAALYLGDGEQAPEPRLFRGAPKSACRGGLLSEQMH